MTQFELCLATYLRISACMTHRCLVSCSALRLGMTSRQDGQRSSTRGRSAPITPPCIVQVEGAEEEEEEDTLAGVSAYALRTFLRQCRELTYQAVGQVAARVPALWQAATLQPAFVVSLSI